MPDPAELRITITHDGTPWIPTDPAYVDALGTLIVTKPSLIDGISDAEFDINNVGGFWCGKLEPGDESLIEIRRSGWTEWVELLHGKIFRVKDIGDNTERDYTRKIICVDDGEPLIVPGNLYTKAAPLVGTKALLQDIITTCCPTLNNAGIDPYNEFTSIHSVEYQDEEPLPIMQELMENCSAGARIGADGYIERMYSVPIVYAFPRGSMLHSFTLSDGQIYSYVRDLNMGPIRNRRYTYGAANKTYPSLNPYSWTEAVNPTEAQWTPETAQGAVGVSPTTPEPLVGTNCLRNESLLTNLDTAAVSLIFRTSPTDYRPNLELYKTIHFALQCTDEGKANQSGLVIFSLEDDQSNIIMQTVTLSDKMRWNPFAIQIGPTSESSWVRLVGTSFNWKVLNKMRWDWTFTKNFILALPTQGTGTGVMAFDRVYIGGRRFSAYTNYSASVTKYGARWARPVVDDSLLTDTECAQRGGFELYQLQDTIHTLPKVMAEGYIYKPGYRLRVMLGNESYDAYHRLSLIKHIVKKTVWDTELSFGEVVA